MNIHSTGNKISDFLPMSCKQRRNAIRANDAWVRIFESWNSFIQKETGMTLNELLDIAIDHEIDSWKLYEQLQAIVADDQARTFLKGLVKEEKTHEDLLYTVRHMEIYDGTVQIDASKVQQSVAGSHAASKEITGDSSINDVLELALQREHRAQTIFVQLAATPDLHAELKQLFEKLAIEEVTHHQNIQKKFAIQTGEMGYEM